MAASMKTLFRKIKREIFRNKINEFENSPAYWDKRYRLGGNSGRGSYGEEAAYKADFINAFIREHGISKALELGCGDGNNLSLIQYPQYVGVDISQTAVEFCRKKFKKQENYSFFWNDPAVPTPLLDKLKTAQLGGPQAFALSLSLDVIYHLVENDIYHAYLDALFGASQRFVLIYSSDEARAESQHVRHRAVSLDVQERFKDFRLNERFDNPVHNNDPSKPHFILFEKKS